MERKNHLFTGGFADLLLSGAQIVLYKHDRKEWLYLVKAPATVI